MLADKVPGLLTDLYQLTMAAGYLRTGKAEQEAVFHLFFRNNPFAGGYSVACGLAQVLELLAGWSFSGDDLAYLATLEGNDGEPLFDDAFLRYLEALCFACDVDAVPEGTVVFPGEPLLRIRGPLGQCQILETPLLTLLNFQTLIATKAARICQAAAGDPVLEFGLRRAQGLDGGLSASRAAYVGGCAGTSNVLAGRRYGIPVKGTHAHSWVMAFDDEDEAFRAYARALPNNCVFLVDTYDTLGGVRRAVEMGRELRRAGHEMLGVRLDSGDLAALSRAASRLLDEAGFPDAAIVASSDLDEHSIVRLKAEGARIGVWGVGTRLATAHGEGALGGVYKLTAIRGTDGAWRHKVKLSEERAKSTHPGIQQVRRFRRGGEPVCDVIYDEDGGISEPHARVDPEGGVHPVPAGAVGEDLLLPVARRGAIVYAPPAIAETRERAGNEVRSLPRAVRRLASPRTYAVGLDPALHRLEERLRAELLRPDARAVGSLP